MPINEAQGRLLYALARATGARTVVEFGTSFGISTIYLAAAVRDNGGGQVIGSEMEPNKVRAARDAFARTGVDQTIEIREGDALTTLTDAPDSIDLLFLDGWKELCLPVLRLLEERLRPGAIILCDDMPPFRRTLKPYVDYVRESRNGFVSMELPLGDGLEVSVLLH